MNSSTFFKGLIASVVIALVGDMLWHNVLLADFYNAKLQGINGGTVPEFSPFIVLLELLASGVTTYFVLAAAKKWTIAEAAFHGALIGFAMVGAINFLNHSLFPGWDASLVAVDTSFGILLGAASGAAILVASGKQR